MIDRYHLHNGMWRHRGLPAVAPGNLPGTEEPPPPPTTSLLVAKVGTLVDPYPPPQTVNRFPGDPGLGNYYVGWAEPQNLATGQGWTGTRRLSIFHGYSTATRARIQESKLDIAINNNCVASQSFKFSSYSPAQIVAGAADADIDHGIGVCKDRAPWPIWLCYYHEPEDNITGETATAQYRAAYRYIVQRFRDANVTNVAWMPIYMCPWTFRRSSDGRPGGGSNRDWRQWHADWNGGSGTAGWHSDRMMDLMGLDVYTPIPGGTSYQDFSNMLDDSLNRMRADGYTNIPPIVIPEYGMSNRSTPLPNWITYGAEARDYAKANDIIGFVYWNNNNDSPRRYDFTAPSDPDGNKLAGWRVIADAAVEYQP